MQEVAQSVATKYDDSKDDFMGFNSVPLVNIPADGLESWFKLRSSHSLQVSSMSICKFFVFCIQLHVQFCSSSYPSVSHSMMGESR